jgi:putative transposase
LGNRYKIYCTREGWLYLATVKDIFTKEIVGWSIADNMKTELCIDALNNVLKKGIIDYSDRGIQDCSNKYRAFLKKHEMICSMIRKVIVMIMPVQKPSLEQ